MKVTMTSPGSQHHTTLDYDDVSLDVIVQGAGPTIVILPSLGRGSDDFDAFSTALEQAGFSVLRPQPRGIGTSVGPMESITLHDLARDVAQVIARLGGGRAIVVGHAFGNWVARMTAVDYPALVRGVCVAGAAAKVIPPQLSAAVTAASDDAAPEAERRAALRLGFFAPGNDESDWLHGWSKAVRISQRAAAAATPQAEWWGAGSAPLLDLQGALDPFKPPEKSRELADDLGDRVSIAVVDGTSHALLVEQPEAVAAALAAWARTLDA